MLECELPPPLVSWGMLRQLGQDLFAPPNVKGWDGGVTWITTNTLLTRYNDAQSLVEGTVPPLTPGDLPQTGGGGGGKLKIFAAPPHGRRGRGKNFDAGGARQKPRTIVAALEHRLFQATSTATSRRPCNNFSIPKPKCPTRTSHAIRLMMSTPEYQVT
jgi:hypothetical protein